MTQLNNTHYRNGKPVLLITNITGEPVYWSTSITSEPVYWSPVLPVPTILVMVHPYLESFHHR